MVCAQVRSKFLSMTGEQLKRQCTDAWLDSTGTKSQMIDRLVDYEKPAGGWPGASSSGQHLSAARAPAPAPAPSVSWGANEYRSNSASQPTGSSGRRLSDKIRTILAEKSRNLRSMFDRMDSRRTGRLSRQDFRRGLSEQLRVNLSSAELDDVLAYADVDRNGEIQYEEFLRTFGPTGASSSGPARGSEEDHIRNSLKRTLSSSAEHIRTAFNAFNRSRDGKIREYEFESGLRDLRISASEIDSQRLFRTVCNMDNVITYEDFVEHFAPGADTLKEVRAVLKTNTRNADTVFQRMDYNRDSHISKNEFRSAMSELGLKIDGRELDELMRIVDSDSRGSINYRDFMQMFGPKAAVVRAQGSVTHQSQRLLADVKAELTATFRRHNVNVETAFEAFDRDRDGTISPLEFRDGLNQLNINLSAQMIQDVLAVIDKDRSGNIDYREFARQFGRPAGSGSSTTGSRVLSELAEIFQRHRVNLDTAFAAFDRNGDGRISRSEFRDGLQRLSVPVSNQQIEDVIQLMANRDGEIEYRDFARQIARAGGSPPSRSSKVGTAPSISPRSRYKRDIPVHIRDELESIFRRHNVDLQSAFSAFDENSDGVISPQEMRRGLNALNIDLTANHVEELIRFMDNDGDGRIDYREFSQVFSPSLASPRRPAPSSGRNGLSRQVISDLKDKFRKYNVNISQAFTAFDANGDGVIDRSEMRRGLDALNMNLTSREIEDIIDHFDQDRSGRIEYSEFVRQFEWNSAASGNWRDVIESLRIKFRDHNVNVDTAFQAFDTNGDGLISPHEFRQGLKELRIDVGWSQVNDLINHFDSRGTGDIEYRAFAREFGNSDRLSKTTTIGGGSIGASSKRLLTEVIAEVKAIMDRQRVNVATAFDAFDTDGDGRISRSEFSTGLKALNVDLAAYQVDELMRGMGNGREINYHEFVRAMSRTRAGTNNADLIRRLSEQLLDKLRRHNADLRQMWSGFDRNSDGEISRDEFCRGLSQLSIRVSDSEIDDIFSVLDPTGRMRLKYATFADMFSESGKVRIKFSYIKDEVRRAMAMARVDLKSTFAAFDRNDMGSISKADFRAGLVKLRIRGVTDRDIDTIMDAMDVDRDGFIDYREFVRQFGGNVSLTLERLSRQLRDVLTKHRASLMTLFKAMDRNDDGILTAREFRSGLRQIGVELSSQQIDDVMMQLDIDNDGYIDYREFVKSFGGDGFVSCCARIPCVAPCGVRRGSCTMVLTTVFDRCMCWRRQAQPRKESSPSCGAR
jgi:calmodulin